MAVRTALTITASCNSAITIRSLSSCLEIGRRFVGSSVAKAYALPQSDSTKRASPFLHINTTVNVERLPSDVVAIHNQVPDRACDFLRRTCPTQRNALQDGLFGLLGNVDKHLGLDEACADLIERHLTPP